MNVHACLEVDARHEKVLVTFKIENRGERRVWLPRAIAADTRLKSRVFDLRLFPGDEPVAYVGTDVGAAVGASSGLADYVELAPHSAHTHTIDVTGAYAFAPGEQTYQIRYAGEVVADSQHPEVKSALATETVMFSHGA
ncbi:hypothetical protein [Massilia sp. 9096]|uniref:hypothetical protein n=1 Tax=Massilia sp. 9096 TaxID=1500894 RepID=UPI000689587C|nr:hypothetical protein [Massilia sp. 9096]